jgi:hypothetical protein
MSVDEHRVTPATILTASRPLLGLKVAHMLLTGEKGTGPWAAVMGLTDLEGGLAKTIDKVFPDSGYGTTEFGAAADPIADVAAVFEVAAASLAAKRVSNTAKLAAGIIIASDGVKAAWATRANARHRATTGQQLIIRPGIKGKTGTASKLVALAAIVSTHELEPGRRRTALGWSALGLAIFGSALSESARRDYSRKTSE